MRRITDEFLAEVRAADLASLTACEIDTLWEPLMYEAQMALARAGRYADLAIEADDKGSSRADHYAALAEEERARGLALSEEQEPFRAVWTDRGGWERVYLVQNHDGHYHRTTACSTCFATTRFAWVPTLSDKTEDEIIAATGHMACTVCWPNAPVHPAFVAGLKAAEAAEEAKREGLCEGTGQYTKDRSGMSYASPRGPCPVCGRTVSVTSTGKVRKHQTREQERISEQRKQGEKDLKRMPAIHALALRVNDAIDTYGYDRKALYEGWLREDVKQSTYDVLQGLLKQQVAA